jgi:anti-sigma regulatory factor (Ser/Thr protein kinase)
VGACAKTRTFGISSGEIGALDCWIEAVGVRWGASARSVFGARLCVAELAANVLEHGIAKADGGPDHITVTLDRCDDEIKIEFVDTRGPFDPTRQVAAAPAANLESVDPRGRGLRLLQAYARDLSYSRDGTRNRVTFRIVSDASVPVPKFASSRSDL